MATIKKATKAKNLSAGPSKKTPKAGPVDPKGNWTKVQERTLGNMKKGGKIKKAQNGDEEVQTGEPSIRKSNIDSLQKKSTEFLNKKMSDRKENISVKNRFPFSEFSQEEIQGVTDRANRDRNRFKPTKENGGLKKNGGPIKKKMKSGGKISTAKDGKWIQKAIKKPGALRAQLGAKPGKPIPAGKLAAAAKKPGKLGQRARLAQTLKKMKK